MREGGKTRKSGLCTDDRRSLPIIQLQCLRQLREPLLQLHLYRLRPFQYQPRPILRRIIIIMYSPLRVERIQYIRQYLRQRHHLAETLQPPPPLLHRRLARILQRAEIFLLEILHRPVRFRYQGRPAVHERAPYILHVDCPGQPLAQPALLVRQLPGCAVEVETEFECRAD